MKGPLTDGVTIVLACSAIAVGVWLLTACTPLPLTPEQRREWSPEYGATDYPTDTARPRDAGADR